MKTMWSCPVTCLYAHVSSLLDSCNSRHIINQRYLANAGFFRHQKFSGHFVSNTAVTSPRQQTNTTYVLHLNMLKTPQWHICRTILELSKTYCPDSERLQSLVHICRCTRWRRRPGALNLSPGRRRHFGTGRGCMDLFKSRVGLHQLAQELDLHWSRRILPLSVSLQVSPLKPSGQMQMERRPSPIIQVPPLRHWFTWQNSPAGGARTSEVTWLSVGASEDASKAAESTADQTSSEHVPLISNSLNVPKAKPEILVGFFLTCFKQILFFSICVNINLYSTALKHTELSVVMKGTHPSWCSEGL